MYLLCFGGHRAPSFLGAHTPQCTPTLTPSYMQQGIKYLKKLRCQDIENRILNVDPGDG